MILELGFSFTVIGEALPSSFLPDIYSLLPFLIFLGMALISVGSARAKNAVSTSLNQWVILATSVIAFVGLGSLVFEGRLPASDWKAFLLAVGSSESDSSWSILVFQTGVVAMALAIACRSMIERIRLRGLMVFSLIFSGIVFPVLAQWAWGSRFAVTGLSEVTSPGWLEIRGVGFYDFAGAGVIHMIGGAFALAGALVVGVRRGRLLSNGRLRFEPGHQPVLISFGVIIALIGWCGFHLGFASLSSAEGGKVVVSTLVASAASGLSALLLYRLFFGAAGFHTALNGVIGGLVSVSSCAASLNPVDALIVGGVAGILVVLGTSLIEKICIDDSGGAIPAHLFCGFWGVVAVAFFGPGEIKSIEGLKTQLVGGLALGLSAFVIALILFKLIDNLFGLRVAGDDQELGSDFNELSLNAYPGFEKAEEV